MSAGRHRATVRPSKHPQPRPVRDRSTELDRLSAPQNVAHHRPGIDKTDVLTLGNEPVHDSGPDTTPLPLPYGLTDSAWWTYVSSLVLSAALVLMFVVGTTT